MGSSLFNEWPGSTGSTGTTAPAIATAIALRIVLILS